MTEQWRTGILMRLILVVAVALVALMCGAPHNTAHAARVLIVRTTADPQPPPTDIRQCRKPGDRGFTLRCAILWANRDGSGDAIRFQIPPSDPGCKPEAIHGTVVSVCSIALVGTLPPLTANGATIDGYTQPGAAPNTTSFTAADDAIITIAISTPDTMGLHDDALIMEGTGDTVRGLAISATGASIVLSGSAASQDKVEGNFLGLAADGEHWGQVNEWRSDGVVVEDGSHDDTIGGTAPDTANVIHGGDSGVAIHAGTSIAVSWNYIGTGASGTDDGTLAQRGLGNGTGVAVWWEVGGPITGTISHNVVSGSGIGVDLSDSTFTVTSNRIGTDAPGTHAIPNTMGVRMYGGDSTIGGPNGSGNVISGNVRDGIDVATDDYNHTYSGLIEGNVIGASASGLPLGNGGNGIEVNDDGWPPTIRANTIAYNMGSGVLVDAPYIPPPPYVGSIPRATITRNLVFANTGLGIDLAPQDHVNCSESPPGPDDYTPCPAIEAASASSVSGTACSGCTVEVFIATNGSGDQQHGGSQSYIGTAVAGTTGAWRLSVAPRVFDPTRQQLTATATTPATPMAPAETSEFAADFPVLAPVTVTTTTDVAKCPNGPGQPGYSLRCALNYANVPGNSKVITFAIPVSDSGCSQDSACTIRPTAPLPQLRGSIILDGYSQAGAQANTGAMTQGDNAVIKVRLDGSLSGGSADGLDISGPGDDVRGLSVTGFSRDGIRLTGAAEHNTIAGNWIGLTPAGARSDNRHDGIDIVSTTPAYSWELSQPYDNVIGGIADSARNVISGNGGNGIGEEADGPGVEALSTIDGNYVGTNSAGTEAIPNGGDGLLLTGSQDLVGEYDGGPGNLISGNGKNGVEITGQNVSIESASIGTDRSGHNAIANAENGVLVFYQSQGTVIANSTVAYNGAEGIAGSPYTTIQQSLVFGNGGLDIDIYGESPTTCGDYSPFHDPQCPRIASASESEVDGWANTGSIVEVYVASDGPNDQGHGGSVQYLGTVTAGHCESRDCPELTQWTLSGLHLNPGQKVTAISGSDFAANVTVL